MRLRCERAAGEPGDQAPLLKRPHRVDNRRCCFGESTRATEGAMFHGAGDLLRGVRTSRKSRLSRSSPFFSLSLLLLLAFSIATLSPSLPEPVLRSSSVLADASALTYHLSTLRLIDVDNLPPGGCHNPRSGRPATCSQRASMRTDIAFTERSASDEFAPRPTASPGPPTGR